MSLDALIMFAMVAGGTYALARLGVQWLASHGLIIPPIRANLATWIVNHWNGLLPNPTDDYVVQHHREPVRTNAGLPDTYQLEPLREPVRTTGTEPVRNHLTDAAFLAARQLDDGSYAYSANKIADLVGGTRTDVLAVIRKARGQAEPVQSDDYQFDQVGQRSSFVRTGVKPLR